MLFLDNEIVVTSYKNAFFKCLNRNNIHEKRMNRIGERLFAS